MRRFLLAFVIVASFVAAARAADADQQPDYCPLAVGDHWRYELMLDGELVETTSEISKVETIDGQRLAVLLSNIGGTLSAEHLSVSDKGIFRHRFDGVEFDPPLCLLKFPIRAGETWTETIKYGDKSYKITGKVEKLEEIEVPAGKYPTVKVSVKTEDDGQAYESFYWFADGLGIVQQLMVMPNSERMLKLVKFDPAK